MSNVTGIAIVIKAFLPTGKTLDEQFTALSIVKTAHETGDYSPLLAASQIDEIKTEQKTRRIDDAPVIAPEQAEPVEPTGTIAGAQIEGDDAGEQDLPLRDLSADPIDPAKAPTRKR